MFSKSSLGVFVLIFLGGWLVLFSGASCRTSVSTNQIKANDEMPPVVLWAWERDEDLRFLDAADKKIGVAFLAQTLILAADEVVFRPRRQPLKLAPETYLIAVTRIETNKEKSMRPRLSDQQKAETAALIKRTLERPNVRAIQIDFDVTVSERNFYKSLIEELRRGLPENFPLTVTALASWCVGAAGDRWLREMPADEAVPMIFRMGADDKPIREFLARDNDWREPLCRGSYGVALDEPVRMNFKTGRRFFVFKSEPNGWQAKDLRRLETEGILR